MASSLSSPDLSELVECFANYLLSSISIVGVKDHRRPAIFIDDNLFAKVRSRNDSFTQMVKDTTDT